MCPLFFSSDVRVSKYKYRIYGRVQVSHEQCRNNQRKFCTYVTLDKIAYLQDENGFRHVLYVKYPKEKMIASQVLHLTPISELDRLSQESLLTYVNINCQSNYKNA